MKDKHEGFTIIEVVLVLAIAGMIFAMTFMVLPSLWANERDTERREDVLAFVRNLKSYQANNSRGALPEFRGGRDYEEVVGEDAAGERDSNQAQKKLTEGTWHGFYRDYFNDDYKDPNGERYNWTAVTCMSSDSKTRKVGDKCNNSRLSEFYNRSFNDNNYTLMIVTSATCDGEDAKLSANDRRVAALYRLEGSGVYCENI